MTHKPYGSSVSWPRVQEILNNALLAWQAANDGAVPQLRQAHGTAFVDDHPYLGWTTKEELQRAVAQIHGDPTTYRLIQPGVKGKDTYLIQALTTGVKKADGKYYPAMPDNGPYISPGEVTEIVDWIDAGMPD